MSQSSIESDWLQDTLAEIAGQLRQSSADHTRCAEQLEQMVADLQLPAGAVIPPRSVAATGSGAGGCDAGSSLEITVTVSTRRQGKS
jgi:hypothetical protein